VPFALRSALSVRKAGGTYGPVEILRLPSAGVGVGMGGLSKTSDFGSLFGNPVEIVAKGIAANQGDPNV
jgi:hypothetical protein